MHRKTLKGRKHANILVEFLIKVSKLPQVIPNKTFKRRKMTTQKYQKYSERLLTSKCVDSKGHLMDFTKHFSNLITNILLFNFETSYHSKYSKKFDANTIYFQ